MLFFVKFKVVKFKVVKFKAVKFKAVKFKVVKFKSNMSHSSTTINGVINLPSLCLSVYALS